MTAAELKEGDRVLTSKHEPATIYMLLPDGQQCVLQMRDQFMPDGGVAFRTVEVASLKSDPCAVAL